MDLKVGDGFRGKAAQLLFCEKKDSIFILIEKGLCCSGTDAPVPLYLTIIVISADVYYL